MSWPRSLKCASGRANTKTVLIIGAVAAAVVVAATAILAFWPSSGSSLTVGTLTIEYPSDWETSDSTTYAQATFQGFDADVETAQDPWFSVEEFSSAPRVLSSMESDVSAAATGEPPVIVEAPQAISVDGLSAVAMTWTLGEWTTRTVVLSPTADVAYRVLFKAPTTYWNGMSDTFSRILASIRIDGARSTTGQAAPAPMSDGLPREPLGIPHRPGVLSGPGPMTMSSRTNGALESFGILNVLR